MDEKWHFGQHISFVLSDLLSHSSANDASLVIDQVKCFKLLGIMISVGKHMLMWLFLKQLLDSIFSEFWKSGLNPHHLLHFYLSVNVIRPVLEYWSAVWHHSLSKTQCKSLEATPVHSVAPFISSSQLLSALCSCFGLCPNFISPLSLWRS